MSFIEGAKHLIDEEIGLIGNVTKTRIKRGHKVGWWVPKSEEEHFLCVLGVNMPRSLVCGTKGLYEVPYRRWSDLMKFRHKTKPADPKPRLPVQLEMNLLKVILAWDPVFVTEGTDGKLRIVTPYNDSFIAQLKLQVPYRHRAWERTQRYWEVSAIYKDIVLKIIKESYGVATPVSSATTP